MKRLISKIALMVLACITIISCFSLTACGDDTSKYNGTYYGYLDGTYFTSSGVLLEGTYTLTLENGKWTGSDDTGNKNFFDFAKGGEYEIKDGSIKLYQKVGNIQMTVGENGTVEENGFRFSIRQGDVEYIYRFLKEDK